MAGLSDLPVKQVVRPSLCPEDTLLSEHVETKRESEGTGCFVSPRSLHLPHTLCPIISPQLPTLDQTQHLRNTHRTVSSGLHFFTKASTSGKTYVK